MTEIFNIGIVGQGFVGGSLATVMAERGCKPLVFDIAGKVAAGGVSTNSFSLTEHIRFCDEVGVDVFFVCLPTPMLPTGHADTRIVSEAVAEISSVPRMRNRERIIVVKSTVPPGTCASWDAKHSPTGTRVVFSPEFLTEARAIDDMRDQDRIVLGGHPTATAAVARIFANTFPGVPVCQTTAINAEMVKYVANCFLAVKVSFANEMRQICSAVDPSGTACSYEKVVEIATLDKRLGQSHWNSPGPDGSYGFGGSCFPKDINALAVIAKEKGVDPVVLEAAWRKNIEVRPERDWELLKGRAVV